MRKCNPENERIKREYFEWQKEANRKSVSTMDNMRKALLRFEQFSGFRDFRQFDKQLAVGFKRHLLKQKGHRSGNPLSKTTVFSVLRHVQEFLRWLILKPGFRRMDLCSIDYLNLSQKEMTVATGRRIKRAPSLDQVLAVIRAMPTSTDIERRNRAVIAFTALTGIRDGAMVSLRLKHIRLAEELVTQVGGEVNTKFSKSISTYFFPVGDEIKQIVVDWVVYLRSARLFGDDDPLFPRTKLSLDQGNSFQSDGIDRPPWQSAGPIREIFREAFVAVGLEYFSPHSFRTMLTRLGEEMCRTPADFKAWSQNLGHEGVLTTFTSYGQIDEFTQGGIIRRLKNREAQDSVDIAELSRKMDILIQNQHPNE